MLEQRKIREDDHVRYSFQSLVANVDHCNTSSLQPLTAMGDIVGLNEAGGDSCRVYLGSPATVPTLPSHTSALFKFHGSASVNMNHHDSSFITHRPWASTTASQ